MIKSYRRRDLLNVTLMGGVATAMMPLSSTLLLAADNRRVGPHASFRYTNPIASVTVRDCQIVKQGDTYYMTGTFPPFWKSKHFPGVRIVSSRDLIHWSKPKTVIGPDASHWYQQLFWAPEIFPHQGKFYLTFNCPANGATPIEDGVPIPQSVALAVADAITGPYTALTPGRPLTDGNDATLFLDTDRHVYVYSAVEHEGFKGIACSQVNLTQGSVIGPASECVPAGGPSDWDGGAKVGIEGPSVFERNGTYYMLYSSWRRGYEVGYATAPHPRGPWTKYSGGPIYGAQDPEWCNRYGSTYTQATDVPFGQVGHGSPFFGPDGRIWFCCHGIEQKGKGRDTEPHLVITPMEFRADGSLAMTLTWDSQIVPLPAAVTDPMWRESGTPASAGPRRK